jgi:hypothetical protein
MGKEVRNGKGGQEWERRSGMGKEVKNGKGGEEWERR